MSYQAVREILNCPQPTGAPRLVLIVLAERANQDGICWPSIPTIAREVGISQRQTKRIVHALEAQGLIAIKYGNGLHHPNIYRLQKRANRDTIDTVPNDETVTSEPETVTSGATNGDSHVTFNSDITMSPKPSENPKEPSEREGALSLETAVALLDAEFPDKPVRTSLSRMVGMKRLLTPAACRQWLTNEKEARHPERRPNARSAHSALTPSPLDIALLDSEAFEQFLQEHHPQNRGILPAIWLRDAERQREFTDWNFEQNRRAFAAARAASPLPRITATHDPPRAKIEL